MAESEDLVGEVAVVTGGSRGIGAAVAATLADAGATVVIAGGSERAGAALADQLGTQHRYFSHDVAEERSWNELIRLVHDEIGDITLLVNNAGVLQSGSDIASTSLQNYERHYLVNQRGVFLGMRAVAGPMKRAGSGVIVNMSSIGAHRGYANQIGYSSTKWAVRGMTKCAAVELAPYGVRVNAVAPGFIDTTMIDVMPREQIDAVTAGTPLGRRGTAGEIAQAVRFLASRECPFMTGAELIVDGGLAL
jgi:3alpha(or 20beta)-hydroxysteroid dehydrogenase